MELYRPNLPKVEVCFSPSQFHLYKGGFQIAVVIDVLRATTAITAALHHGVEKIIPVEQVDQARAMMDKGYLAAAERNGKIVDGFPMGNSPRAFLNPELKGASIALTTTNGTRAIKLASDMPLVVIGALVNLDAVCQFLLDQQKDVLLLGSGWKDKFNLEDTICAGAIADQLIESGTFQAAEDSTIAAKFIYRSARENIFSFLKASSHRRRLRSLNLNEDVKFCLTPNTMDTVPVLEEGSLVKKSVRHA